MFRGFHRLPYKIGSGDDFEVYGLENLASLLRDEADKYFDIKNWVEAANFFEAAKDYCLLSNDGEYDALAAEN